MKKLSVIILAVSLLIFCTPCVYSAEIITYDFTDWTDANNLSVNSSGKSVPSGWGVANGTPKTTFKKGDFGLHPDNTYAYITNASTDGYGYPRYVGPNAHRIIYESSPVNISENQLVHITAAIAVPDSTNINQVGIAVTQADITYTPAGGVKTVKEKASPASSYESLIAFIKKNGNANNAVIIESWGQDITPEGFVFEENRFYRLDAVVNGTTNTVDAYLDGVLLATVDYTSYLLKAVSLTEEECEEIYISSFRRIDLPQHKVQYTGDFSVGFDNVGVYFYPEGDALPPVEFMPDDFELSSENTLVKTIDKSQHIVMENKQAKISELRESFVGDGILDIYKDADCTEKYTDSDYVEYPAYAKYYSKDGYQLFSLPLLSELYIKDGEITVLDNKIIFSGSFENLKSDNDSAVMLLCGYKNGIIQFVHVNDIALFKGLPNDFTQLMTVTTDKEYDKLIAWAIDSRTTGNVISKVFVKNFE